MTSHKDHRLDQLGITSQDEADELQRELGIRFDRFTYHDRKVWNQQNSYLQAHARTRTVSDSADLAGVTISTAQAWKYLDTLGFTRRLEIADLRFSDRLQVMALDRAREPDAPASLLIALLRAHIPEKYSANGHLCDTSKSDELLFHYRQDAQRELAAGHPTLRAIANGTYQPPQDSPSHTNLSSAEGDNEHPNLSTDRRDTAHPNLSPDEGENTTTFDLSPDEGENTTTFDLSPGEGENTTTFDLSPDEGENTTTFDLSPDEGENTTTFDLSPGEGENTTTFDLSPGEGENTTTFDLSPGEGENTTTFDLSPGEGENTTTFDLSPGGGETQRGGFSPTTQYVAEETTSQDDYPPLDPDEFAHFNLSPTEGDTAHPNLSPTDQTSVGAGFKPAHDLSPTGGETQRGGSPSAPNRHPIASLHQTARRPQHNDRNTFKVTRF